MHSHIFTHTQTEAHSHILTHSYPHIQTETHTHIHSHTHSHTDRNTHKGDTNAKIMERDCVAQTWRAHGICSPVSFQPSSILSLCLGFSTQGAQCPHPIVTFKLKIICTTPLVSSECVTKWLCCHHWGHQGAYMYTGKNFSAMATAYLWLSSATWTLCHLL